MELTWLKAGRKAQFGISLGRKVWLERRLGGRFKGGQKINFLVLPFKGWGWLKGSLLNHFN